MAENDPASSRSLAEQALSNLVNQFARPMDFLRELVQNSIDAGTPRIDVYVTKQAHEDGDASSAVLEIHLDDYGEGMDEQIIDNQLTRLFSSTKEDDLTKIGKFGIGFTSIFAIRPDLVRLLTGRHGEFWELIFHPDRTYEKRPYAEPVTGTQITLYKRMETIEIERTVQEARFILTYWCEHSNVPITFQDRTGGAAAAPAADSADPFAAFMDGEAQRPAGDEPEPINSPLGLAGSDLEVMETEEDIVAVAAYVDRPRYGFYNGGLTLISSENTDVLGEHAETLSHLAFKVKSDALEHTLTRDNVLQDEHWDRAMAVVKRAAHKLRAKLLDRIDNAEGKELDRLQGYLATETQLAGGYSGVDDWWDAVRPVFRDHAGNEVSRKTVEEQERRLHVILTDPGEGPLRKAVVAQGDAMLTESRGTRRLLEALGRPRLLGFFPRERYFVRADHFYVLPEIEDLLGLPPQERMLVEATAALLHKTLSGSVTLKVGQFGGSSTAVEEELALISGSDSPLFQRPSSHWYQWLPSLLQRRTLLINRHHPHFQAQSVAAAENMGLAAFALAQALLMHEGSEPDRTFTQLLEAAHV